MDSPPASPSLTPSPSPTLSLRATATGPWPGTDPLQACRAVFGELGGDDGIPFLPHLPARGPGADAVGRTAAMLVEMPVDLQPMGWRLVDRPGLDAARAASLATADTDALAEAADGWSGPLVVQVVGPWTLAASLWLPRGERAVVDAGARRDLAASWAEGIRDHVAAVRRLVPGAQVTLAVDEPGLLAVLQGRLPTVSGWGRLPAVDRVEVLAALRDVVASIPVPVVLRGPGPDVPLGLLREAGPAGLAVDPGALGPRGWESLATAVEAGQAPWLGVLEPIPPPAVLPSANALVDAVQRGWHEVGLPDAQLASAVLLPTAGLAALSAERAVAVLRRLREAVRAMQELALSA